MSCAKSLDADKTVSSINVNKKNTSIYFYLIYPNIKYTKL